MASVKNLSNPEVAFEAKLKIVLQMVYNQVIRRPCWCTKQQQIMAHVLHNDTVKFPKDFVLFCCVHQNGGDDVRENHLFDTYHVQQFWSLNRDEVNA